MHYNLSSIYKRIPITSTMSNMRCTMIAKFIIAKAAALAPAKIVEMRTNGQQNCKTLPV